MLCETWGHFLGKDYMSTPHYYDFNFFIALYGTSKPLSLNSALWLDSDSLFVF